MKNKLYTKRTFVNHISNKRHVSIIYEVPSKFNSMKTNNPFVVNGQRAWTDIFPKGHMEDNKIQEVMFSIITD